jgi:hypothetical protein
MMALITIATASQIALILIAPVLWLATVKVNYYSAKVMIFNHNKTAT